jgi:hypothetical protein
MYIVVYRDLIFALCCLCSLSHLQTQQIGLGAADGRRLVSSLLVKGIAAFV